MKLPLGLTSILTSTIALTGSVLADGIAPQPIGLLDKKWATNLEQSDFYCIVGRSRHGLPVPKVVFTAKIKDIPKTGMEQRAVFVHQIQREDFVTYDKLIDPKAAPLTRVATYTVKAGTKFDSFLPLGNNSSQGYKKNHYERMFFHVPGKGAYVAEGAKAPVLVRAESAKDLTMGVKGTAIRYNSYVFDNVDPELQARIFFSAVDPKKGREPFISAGTSKTSKVLKDINTTAKTGSDPEQFAALGSQLDQRMFFVAKNPADGDNYNLWRVTFDLDSKNRPVYGAVPFATSTTLGGKPENLISNGVDLFFTAPAPGGANSILWRLNVTGADATDLETYNVKNPQDLVFINEDSSYGDLAFSVDDGTARRFARYSPTNDLVSVVGAAAQLSAPELITPADNYFYFADLYQGAGDTYLEKYGLADNMITDITINNGANYPRNISEICRVSNTIYFVADGMVQGTYQQGVLFRIDNDSDFTFHTDASVVLTDKTNPNTALPYPVYGAHNLRPVIYSGGAFRLYFSAEVSTTVNPGFMPPNSTITSYGTKPWVTAVDGN
jgi:ELWxxDGT repeat protein